MTKYTEQPPRLFLKFFRWFCRPRMLDYIEGDLLEVYKVRSAKLGKRKADLKFMMDVLLLFRPGIIKPTTIHKNLYNPVMIRNYFKVGYRNIAKNRGYSFINITGLALSITCAIFIFSFVKYNLSFDNFHENPDRIYRIVTELHRDVIAYRNNVPSPLGEFFRNDYTYGEKVARVYTELNPLIILRNGDDDLTKFEEPGGIAFSETEFFDIFNFPLLHGDKEKVLTEPNTAIITEHIARKYFGDKDAIGETFWLQNKIPFTVTGILKDLPANTDIKSEIFVSYSTLKTHDPFLASDTDGWGGIRDGMKCYTLLRPNTSIAKVEEVLSAYVKIYRPTSKNVHHYKLQPLADIHFNSNYGGAMAKSNLMIVFVIGLFLIVTACVNFINLATAQALKRSKEVGVRKVLGSLKTQLFWQFIFETGIITFAGIIIAAALSYTIFPFVNQFFGTQIPINIFSDGSLLFIVGLGIVVTFFAGSYPGLVLAGFQPVAALKGKLSRQAIGGFNTRRTLIVVQFAISQVLIIGMVVITNQMRYTQQSDLGFDKDAIVLVAMANGTTPEQSKTMKTEIQRIPGVEKLSLCFTAPSSEDDWGNSIRFENSSEEVNFRTSIKSADADYISTFDLKLVAGRNIQQADTVREMIINEAMVRKLELKSAEDALGKMITANGGSMHAPIVGVVKDFHDKSFHEEISPVLITTYTNDYSNYAIKLNLAEAKSTIAAIEKLWLQQHPDQIFKYQFVDESIARFYESEKTTLKLIQIFSFIAIIIGCLGLYGLVSFMVSQKTKEIGIRKVLGGTAAHIVWIFGQEFTRLIVVAFLIAAPIGWWFMNDWLQAFKFHTTIGLSTFMLAIGCSLMVAAVTVCYQVIRTAFANPVKSLRIE